MAAVDSVEATTVMDLSTVVDNVETTTKSDIDILKKELDNFFLIVMGIIVFLMQCGFAFLEAGAVRSKNAVNILIKNMLDALIGGLSYWAIGWGLAYGEGGNPFCGGSEFFSYNMDHSKYASWFFQFVFAATAATIISGSVAERCHFYAYFAYSIIITGWVYPPVSHWAWGDGWLSELGFQDFAGSGVVHLCGGVCALIGCYFLGPRLGRFTKEGKPIDMPGHSVPLAGLGGFILLVGFLAFNGGSEGGITSEGNADAVGLAIVNTILGGVGGGITALLLNFFLYDRKWSYLTTLNGTLTGMVAQCAGCNVYEPWAAVIIGSMAGPVFMGVHELMLRLRLDDPLDAVAVHGGGGTLGLFVLPFFKQSEGIFWLGGTGAPWKLLGIQIAGFLAIFAWSFVWATLVFGGMKLLGYLRIDRETEFKGNDMIKHGESAYPRDAWVELQYNRKFSKANESIMPHMSGAKPGEDVKGYNNAMEMMPTMAAMSKLVRQSTTGSLGIDNKTFEE